MVLANRCGICGEPKSDHQRDKEGNIQLKPEKRAAVERRRGQRYMETCMPNPYAARKLVADVGGEADYSRGIFARKVAPR